jgi:D-alanyl-D-alanine carboxypeptidase/D-alanyl-D-alanine-endopeptidase (penicillin-binding protein 4)
MRRPARLVVPAAVLAVVTYVGADVADVVPGVLTASPPAAARAPRPTPSDPPRVPAQPALPALSVQAPRPVPGALRTTLRPLLASRALGRGVSASVLDAATGAPLLDVGATTARVPASTTKLLTGAAVLSTVGGGTRMPTAVVQGRTPDEVVLVGGGDMLLGTGASRPTQVVGRAGLGTLARQVAGALQRARRPRVVVRFDDSAFAGGTTAPTWAAADVRLGLTGRVAALGLARDRARPGHPGAADPALSTARAFAAALRRAGVQVAGVPARTTAPGGAARTLGRVDSAPVADVLGVALRESDNALAEALARLVARAAGRPPTFPAAAAAVLDQVRRLGVDTGPTRIVDASGLGRGSRVPARVLADVLRLAASDDHPQLRPLLQGLPVSGFTGTLAERFRRPPAAAAAGRVRAKTGTLTGVNTLAGFTVDADGRLLVFAVLADHVPAGGTPAARAAMDRVAAALAACGCR